MQLINQAKGILLADNAIIADTHFKRMKGLLGRREFRQGAALILKPCNFIHTFFMRFPIDCLFVDKNKKVKKAVQSLAPFRICGPCFSSSMVIELPAGTLVKYPPQEGDTLVF